MNRIVTISFTPLDAPGGVPKFNRDLHSAFPDRECVHFSWWDFPWYIEMEHLPEWEKARTLNHYLIQSRKLLPTDVVVADGFWADGLQHMKNAVSHSHGIWSHLTKEDVDAGAQPDMPFHHAAQVNFRRRWTDLGKCITAVSDFIANQMELQWGFKVDRVINNGVDTDLWAPMTPEEMVGRGMKVPLIVHGVNDRGNANKGWDHIKHLKQDLQGPHGPVIVSLDELCQLLASPEGPRPKHLALREADFVVHPSGYEGNSMFVAEALACGVPVVGYDVGFLWKLKQDGGMIDAGVIMPRTGRTVYMTTIGAETEIGVMAKYPETHAAKRVRARQIALEHLSLETFKRSWREYVEEVEWLKK